MTQNDTPYYIHLHDYCRMKCQIEEVQDSITALQVSTKNAQAVAETQKNITVATASHLARKGGKSALGIKNDNNYANRNSWSNKGNEAQNRFGKSEASVKPYVNINTSNNGKDGTYAVSTTNSNSADSEGDGFSNSNDEDICMAAAMEVSQSLKVRSYEPMTPTPSYARKLDFAANRFRSRLYKFNYLFLFPNLAYFL